MPPISPPPMLQKRTLGSVLSALLLPVARRFIAGTTLAEALQVCAQLKAQGFTTTLDYLGEQIANAEEAAIAAEQYIVILKALKERGLDRNISIKLTQLGLGIDPGVCAGHLAKIVAAAEAMRGFVRVDMEGSDVTQAIIAQVERAKRTRLTPVGVALQAMQKRTPADAVQLLGREIPIRLCKGAYKEPPAIAHQKVEEVRAQFLALAKRLVTAGQHPAIATHDRGLIDAVLTFAREHGIGPEQFELQMLLGIRRSLAQKLIADGWRVRIYVPFGRAWLPYTLRRLRERKENVWFVVKHLFVH